MANVLRGKVYVVGDNIDTDQIIPAQYLSLVPTIPDEYKRLGGYAMCGLPREAYPTRLIEPDQGPSSFTFIVAGRNFGCGSSREHAPIALGAAGIKAVIAESFARIFFRNCIATGEVYPIETPASLRDSVRTGDEITLELDKPQLTQVNGSVIALRPLGEVLKVVSAGGLFAYARATGLVPAGSAT
jgi:3-isopropylmalate/(R)-2-methylmalate dehydratase small subunit